MPRISLSEVGHQNIVYSDAEQTVIKNALETTEASLLQLATLRNNGPARRRQLEDQIRRYNVALAPFKKVPNEIWMYIFKLYHQFSRLSTCNTRQSSPVVLSQVCSAWRQIALSMPELWSDIHLRNDVNLAKIWLARAGNIPRALETSSHCPSSNRSQTIQSLICSFPFRKLHLTQCDAVGIDFAEIPVESLLPLEDLALLKSAESSSNLVISLYPHHFPNLVSLSVHFDTNIPPLFSVSRPFATWKKLRILRLEFPPLSDGPKYLQILRDAASVEDCSLRLSRLSLVPFYGHDSVVLASLKIFRLFFPTIDVLWMFLNRLTFPNLHTLILTPPHTINFQPRDKSSLLRLVPRFGSLRSLNFDQFYTNVDICFVLECLPLLQILELHCNKITTPTAKKIGRGELGGCLHELRDWSSSNLNKFLKACELRRDVTQGQSQNNSGAIARLEKVSVGYSKSVTSCKQRICKLGEDGIQFEVLQVSSRVRST